MILGLCGYSKVGKDALAKELQNYERFAFADVLKQEVGRMLKEVRIEPDLWTVDKEFWRDLLVFWGRKRREMDKDYWIKQLYMRMAPIEDKRIVITDCRYPNEVRFIQKYGIVIGLDRPGYGPANEEEAISIKQVRLQHPEVPWLINDGTLRELEIAARASIKQCLNKRGGGIWD